MSSVIKNIPPIHFGYAGNRGGFFPATFPCGIIPQPYIQTDEFECWLVKEEDGYTNIYSEINYLIGVDCVDPIQAPCYLVIQENQDIELLCAELEDDFIIFCDELPDADVAFISLQEDVSIPIIFDPYERKFLS